MSRSQNLSQTTRPCDSQQQQQQKKRNCQLVVFAYPTDHKVKLKENQKRDKYLDLARELKKLWNMEGIGIQIVSGALSRVTERFVQRLNEMDIGG